MMKYKVSFEEFQNIGKIDQLRIGWEETGNILVFPARNGVGKSTATSFLINLLKDQVIPEPLKFDLVDGEKVFRESGYYRAGLKDENGDVTEILFKMDGKDHQTLTVIMPNGHAMPDAKQKTFLSRLAQDKRSFYIPDYLEVTAPQKRMEMILKLLPVDAANVIAEDSKKLKEVREKRQKAFQDVALQKGKAVVFDEALAEKEAISAADLAAQKGAIEKGNSIYYQAQTALIEIEQRIAEFPKTKSSLEADKLAIKSQYDQELERLRLKFESDTNIINDRISKVDESEKEAKERLEKAQKWLADTANTPKSTDEIDAQLQNLNIENQKIADAKRVKAEHVTLKTYQAVWEGLNTVCRDAEVALRAKMTESALPAGLGIEIDEDAILSLTLGGVPLEQSSSSERTIAQLHLSLLSMGDLGFVRFDGTLVDDGNMADVMAWLKKHEYQAAIEIMERSGEKTVTYEVADSYFKIDDEPTTEPPTLFN